MRHGRSRADDEMVHEGRYDSPLTDIGRFVFGDACFVRTSYDPESDLWTIREMSA